MSREILEIVKMVYGQLLFLLFFFLISVATLSR